MSYIRAGCNPESLYVLGTVGNMHDFYWTDREGNPQKFFIPSDDFDEFFTRFRKWEDEHDIWNEVFEYKGINLRTVTFHEGLKRILTEKEIAERDNLNMLEQLKDGGTNHLICLTYNDYPPLVMWEVTWDRLRESAYDHLFWPNWFVRKINKLFGHGGYRLL